jgi:glutathione S-transferase
LRGRRATITIARMTKISLTYFDVRGRAEPIRLLLAYAGVPFEDRGLTGDAFAKERDAAPLGQLPYLVEDDGGVKRAIPQSMAILRHLARAHGLDGKDEGERLAADVAAETANDLRNAHSAFKFSPAAGDEAAKAKFFGETVPPHLRRLDKLLGDRAFFAADAPTWADLFAFETLERVVAASPTSFEAFPRLATFVARVAARPELVRYFATRRRGSRGARGPAAGGDQARHAPRRVGHRGDDRERRARRRGEDREAHEEGARVLDAVAERSTDARERAGRDDRRRARGELDLHGRERDLPLEQALLRLHALDAVAHARELALDGHDVRERSGLVGEQVEQALLLRAGVAQAGRDVRALLGDVLGLLGLRLDVADATDLRAQLAEARRGHAQLEVRAPLAGAAFDARLADVAPDALREAAQRAHRRVEVADDRGHLGGDAQGARRRGRGGGGRRRVGGREHGLRGGRGRGRGRRIGERHGRGGRGAAAAGGEGEDDEGGEEAAGGRHHGGTTTPPGRGLQRDHFGTGGTTTVLMGVTFSPAG